MADNKNLGTAVAGETSKNFGKVAGLDTPSGIMTVFDKFLTGMTQPVPWQQAKDTLEGILKNVPGASHSDAEMAIEERMYNYVNGQGELDRAGLVRFIGDTFNELPQSKETTPGEKLLRQASDMLARLGIEDDQNHSLAAGIAKSSMVESTYVQEMEKSAAAREAQLRNVNTSVRSQGPGSTSFDQYFDENRPPAPHAYGLPAADRPSSPEPAKEPSYPFVRTRGPL